MSRRTRTLVVGLVLACLLSIAAAANQPPVARISAYRATAGGSSVVFDGSASTDTDGQVVRYQWLFGDGTTGSGSPVTHSYPQPSAFTVTLLVGDNGGASTLVTQVVDVASLPTQGAAAAATTTPPAPAAADVPIGNTVGLRAPEIALPSMTGSMVYLSTYLGRPVLVEFWLSTCPGCIASTAALEHYRSLYADKGLVVMLVVLDRSPGAATTFLNQYGYRNFVLAWESSASRPTMAAYGVVVTPTSFLIDRAGVIRYAGGPSGLSDTLIQSWL